jgi:hypothetical protein
VSAEEGVAVEQADEGGRCRTLRFAAGTAWIVQPPGNPLVPDPLSGTLTVIAGNLVIACFPPGSYTAVYYAGQLSDDHRF